MVKFVPANLRTEFSTAWYSLEPGMNGLGDEGDGDEGERARTAVRGNWQGGRKLALNEHLKMGPEYH
jgi:hypothetical protein